MKPLIAKLSKKKYNNSTAQYYAVYETAEGNTSISDKKVCSIDPSHTTYIDKKYGTFHWFRYQDGWLCSKCHDKLYYQQNKSKKLAYQIQYKIKNPNKIKQISKRYRVKNKTELATKRKKYFEIFPNKQRDHGRKVREKIRSQIFDIIGRKCIRCGFSDIRALQFDHINGDGYIDNKRHKSRLISSYTILREYRDNPDLARQKLQTLCANCNQIKRFNKNENVRIGIKS